MGEYPFLHAGQKDHWKLKPLGVVQGHEQDLPFLAVILVGFCCQGHGFQVGGQALVIAVLFKFHGRGDQLLKVFDTALAVVQLAELQHLKIAGILDDMVDELADRIGFAAVPQLLHDRGELADLVAHTGAELWHFLAVVKSFHEAPALELGKFPDFFQGGCADAALRYVHDAHKADIVQGIDEHMEVGNNILDFHT